MIRPSSERNPGGRKPLQAGVESCIVPIRMTPDQRAKYLSLGGPRFVRKCIDNAFPAGPKKVTPRDSASEITGKRADRIVIDEVLFEVVAAKARAAAKKPTK